MSQSGTDGFMQAAIAHHQAGRLPEAEALYRQVLARFPDHAACYSNLGYVLQAQGSFEDAIRSHQRALALKPDDAEGHCNLGNVFFANGQLDDAIASYGRALVLRPGHALTHIRLGNALQSQGRLDEALQAYQRALAIEPGHAEAHNSIGYLLAQKHQTDKAIEAIRQALAARPDYAEAWQNLGTQYEEKGDAGEALACYDRAVALKPDFAAAHNSRGNALLALGDLAASEASYLRALAITPDFPQAFGNLGLLWQARGDIDRAIACYDRMLALDPASADARWNKATALLLKGDFAAGWALCEWRWKFDDPRRISRTFTAPLWLGAEPLAGRTLLLHHEQGLGDTLQMLRYVPVLAGAGARVVIQVPPALTAIAATVPGCAAVIRDGAPAPAPDLHCPFMSLPLALKTTLDSIPAQVPYLFAPGPARRAWEEHLGPAARPRVGLVWSGSTTHRNDRQRSIALRRLLPLLDADAEFISLQKEYRPADRQVLDADGRIRDCAAQLGDFADTAGLIEHLDLLITVDTSVAHLAGAMGRPVWLLLPYAADYRWLLKRTDSPWYATMRLFRQPAFGDWESVVAGLVALLGPALQAGRGKPAA